jgi:ABC-2 type transport system ATP-binding protein
VEALTVQRGFFAIGLAAGQALPEAELRALGFAVSPLRLANQPEAARLWELEIVGDQSIDQVVDFLRSRGLSLRHLLEKRQTLEDLFLAVVRDERRQGAPASPRPEAVDRSAATSFTEHSQGTDFSR